MPENVTPPAICDIHRILQYNDERLLKYKNRFAILVIFTCIIMFILINTNMDPY
jgi:hypothetical protein